MQRHLIHTVFGLPFHNIRIGRTSSGKPYLIPSSIPQHFAAKFPLWNWNYSVSHHGDFVAIASEACSLVGLDIMDTHHRRVAPGEANCLHPDDFFCRFLPLFSDTEWHDIRRFGHWDHDEQYRQFFRHWALKEAYVKAVGTGLDDIKSLQFRYCRPAESNCEVAIGWLNGIKLQGWRFRFQWLEPEGTPARHIACVSRGHFGDADPEYCAASMRSEVPSFVVDEGLVLPHVEWRHVSFDDLVPACLQHRLQSARVG